MNRRSFAKSISSVLLGTALSIGFVLPFQSKWKFHSKIFKLANTFYPDGTIAKASEWMAILTQLPAECDISKYSNVLYKSASQYVFKAPGDMHKSNVQSLADRAILQRKYDIGEPDGVENAGLEHPQMVKMPYYYNA